MPLEGPCLENKNLESWIVNLDLVQDIVRNTCWVEPRNMASKTSCLYGKIPLKRQHKSTHEQRIPKTDLAWKMSFKEILSQKKKKTQGINIFYFLNVNDKVEAV